MSSKGISLGRRNPFPHYYLCSGQPLFPQLLLYCLGGQILDSMRVDALPYTQNALPEIVVTYTCKVAAHERLQVRSSRDAADVFRQLWQAGTIEYKEQFYVLCLNRRNQLLGYFLHSIGGLSGTIVDTKQILAVAVKANAASILLCHNHPSGNTKPSTADTDITRKIVRGAAFLDVDVLDHLILTDESYYSFADEGVMPAADTSSAVKLSDGYGLR